MLKKVLIGGSAAILVAGSALYALPAFGQGAVPPPAAGQRERHPIIHRSINQLDRVEKELAKADNDFKGHKEKARDLIRQAIAELKEALRSDRR